MTHEAIILAGGLGTRLREVVENVPKCMAPVNNQPFIKYIIDYLLKNNITRFIFSVGYKSEMIIDYITTNFPHINVEFCIEKEPLGTGGAIQLAMNYCNTNDILIINGDTYFDIPINDLYIEHNYNKSRVSIALKMMFNFDRYGVVKLNEQHIITEFNEKKLYDVGLINGGIYIIHKPYLLSKHLPQKFSFEKDFLEKYFIENTIYGFAFD
ncbi:MAG: sugar phosphate nucleotidyltransferase, partial [Sediminibacterium sp.]|nr:sugar phosphate nucleotidyltransferase [Sediminibacterium sp.]